MAQGSVGRPVTRNLQSSLAACALAFLAACGGAKEPGQLVAVFNPDRVVARGSGPVKVELRVQNVGDLPLTLPGPLDVATGLRCERIGGGAAPPAGAAADHAAPPPPSDPLPAVWPPGERKIVALDLAARFPELRGFGAYRVTWDASGLPPTSLDVAIVEGYATIETNFGDIAIELHPEDAPRTVENFIKLAKQGFYNNLNFHRIVPGFMMQGGDPKGDGSGDAGFTIKAEFNSRSHKAGTVAMARSEDPDSAGSQFYICFAPRPELDGRYTTFAEVVKGMDVAKQIERVGTPDDPPTRGKPTQRVYMRRVTVSDVPPRNE